ncbi:MAG: MoaD/ThiS family protein [Acidiferrobacteraceae bacterium]
MIRVVLPYPLRELAGIGGELMITPEGRATLRSVLDAIETSYPMLRGTIRDHVTCKRRPLVRFFACGEDLSLQSSDDLLPGPVRDGQEPLLIIGAIAGG